MVVTGAISMPDSAPMAAASVNVRLPDILVLMPTSRAPRRLTAVARKARPYRVLPKKIHSAMISSAQVASTKKVWADHEMAPIWISPSMNGGVRQPSAPKKTRRRAVRAKCTATEIISSTRTLASATGWYTRRYTMGPRGMTSASAYSTLTHSGVVVLTMYGAAKYNTRGTASDQI